MTTTLKSLESQFRIRIGDTESGAWQWTSSQLVDALDSAVKPYNVEAPLQEFEVLGSGDDRYVSPDPTQDDLNLLMLYGELVIIQAELRQGIRTALIRTTPVGHVNMVNIPQLWKAEIARVRAEISRHKDSIAHDDALAEMTARDMSISDPGSVATETLIPSISLTKKLIINDVAKNTFEV